MHIAVIIVFTIIVLFISMLAFSWRSDVSAQEPYKHFLNTPLEIKTISVIKKDSIGGRFTACTLSDYHPEQGEHYETKQVLNVGDTIEFHAAKSFYSMHVGKTHHLIGKHTLASREVITFECYLFDGVPMAWETLEEYFKRKKVEVDSIE